MKIINSNFFKKIVITILMINTFNVIGMQQEADRKNDINKLSIFSSLPQEKIIKTVTEIIASGSTVAETLQKELNSEHNKLIREIQKEYPKQKWSENLALLEKIKSQDQQTLMCENPIIKDIENDHPLVKITKKLLASYKINPKAICIELKKTVSHTASCNVADFAVVQYVTDKIFHFLRIMPDLEIPLDQIDAILRHEIIHLINYDVLETSIIQNTIIPPTALHWLPKGSLYTNNPLFMKLAQFKETRADLLAACHSINTAKALKNYFSYMQNKGNNDVNDKSHACLPDRQKEIDQLLQYMEIEEQLKKNLI